MTSRQILSALFVTLLFGSLLLAACESGRPDTPTAVTVPASATAPATDLPPGLLLLQERCVICHTLQPIESARKTQAEWERTVQRMVDRGARLSDAEFTLLVEYLTANYK